MKMGTSAGNASRRNGQSRGEGEENETEGWKGTEQQIWEVTGQREQRVQRWAENVPGRAALSDVASFIKWKICLKSS